MGVRVIVGFEDDFKPELNNDPKRDRYTVPTLLKIKFVDEKTGSVMFSYAPKSEDEDEINRCFRLLKAYDPLRKQIHNLVVNNRIEEVKK